MGLGAGGGRRTASLGAGSSRGGSVVSGASGRSSSISGLAQETVGFAAGSSVASAVGDFSIVTNVILQENGDDILLETGSRLLLEDGLSFGTANGVATVTGVGSSLVNTSGTISGIATVAGVIEAPGAADNLLKEDGDDLLLESGDFLLKEDGSVVPPTALLDTESFAITDTNGDYILEP